MSISKEHLTEMAFYIGAQQEENGVIISDEVARTVDEAMIFFTRAVNGASEEEVIDKLPIFLAFTFGQSVLLNKYVKDRSGIDLTVAYSTQNMDDLDIASELISDFMNNGGDHAPLPSLNFEEYKTIIYLSVDSFAQSIRTYGIEGIMENMSTHSHETINTNWTEPEAEPLTQKEIDAFDSIINEGFTADELKRLGGNRY